MADGGFGASITFESSHFAEVRSFEFSDAVRRALETTHMATSSGKATFIPSDIVDNGTITIEYFTVANTDPWTILDNAAASFTFTYPIPAGGSVAATVAGTAFMIGKSETVPHDELMIRRGTLKITGGITFTAGS